MECVRREASVVVRRRASESCNINPARDEETMVSAGAHACEDGVDGRRWHGGKEDPVPRPMPITGKNLEAPAASRHRRCGREHRRASLHFAPRKSLQDVDKSHGVRQLCADWMKNGDDAVMTSERENDEGLDRGPPALLSLPARTAAAAAAFAV
jgi:hypothetical protein